MLNSLTPSQISEQYVLSSYPCLGAFVVFVQSVFPNLLKYSPTSCSQVASICNAAMKAIEYIQQTEPNAQVVRVSRRLNDLYQIGWQGWTAFKAQSNVSTGSMDIGTTPAVLQGIAQFNAWDNALVQTPAFNPSTLLNTMLGGVSP